MLKLLVVFAAALLLAYISEKNTEAIMATGQKYTVWKDWAYILLVMILVLFAELRTSYNDRADYEIDSRRVQVCKLPATVVGTVL